VGLIWSGATPALRRNLLLDLVAACGVGVTTARGGSLLPTVARRQGLDPLGLAVLAAAPFLANLLGVFAGRLGPRTPRHLGVLRSGGAVLLVAVVLAPIPAVLSGVAIGFWLTMSFGSPIQHRLWGIMYPPRERGRLIGVVSTGRTAAAGAAALLGGVLADRVGGMAVVALAGGIGALCAMSAGAIRAPLAADPPPFSARGSWRAFRDRPALRRIGLAQVFYGGGLVAAAPLYALVQVDRLSLSLTEVGTIGILAALASAASCLAWGALADRHGGITPIQIGSVLAFVALVGYAFAPSVAILWLCAILLGLASAAMETGWPNVLAEHTPLEDRAAAAAGLNALTGARGLIMPFLGTALVQAGLIDVTGALLLCAGFTSVGVALYAHLGADGEPRPWRQVYRDASVGRGMRRARALIAGAALRG
jgi:MFS family permease